MNYAKIIEEAVEYAAEKGIEIMSFIKQVKKDYARDPYKVVQYGLLAAAAVLALCTSLGLRMDSHAQLEIRSFADARNFNKRAGEYLQGYFEVSNGETLAPGDFADKYEGA
jgi:hypothetical protein